MRWNEYRGIVWSSLLVLGLSMSNAATTPAIAQDAGTAGGAQMQSNDDMNDDDDTDWGWVGLLGLAGLLGLRRRDHTHVHTTDRIDTTARTTRP